MKSFGDALRGLKFISILFGFISIPAGNMIRMKIVINILLQRKTVYMQWILSISGTEYVVQIAHIFLDL